MHIGKAEGKLMENVHLFTNALKNGHQLENQISASCKLMRWFWGSVHTHGPFASMLPHSLAPTWCFANRSRSDAAWTLSLSVPVSVCCCTCSHWQVLCQGYVGDPGRSSCWRSHENFGKSGAATSAATSSDTEWTSSWPTFWSLWSLQNNAEAAWDLVLSSREPKLTPI